MASSSLWSSVQARVHRVGQVVDAAAGVHDVVVGNVHPPAENASAARITTTVTTLKIIRLAGWR
ncbi:MAG: hypothetical protein ACLUFT_11200 [Gemmiger formicilis]|uniref:hypothetical protein n=1 Tax=Gemmiger formicilis TaxID=745368 RepID=UPI00399253C6